MDSDDRFTNLLKYRLTSVCVASFQMNGCKKLKRIKIYSFNWNELHSLWVVLGDLIFETNSKDHFHWLKLSNVKWNHFGRLDDLSGNSTWKMNVIIEQIPCFTGKKTLTGQWDLVTASFNTPSSLCSRKYVYVKVKFYSVIVSQCHSFVLRTLKLETWNFSDSMIEKNTVTERIYIQNYHFIYNTNYYISFAWFNFQSQCFVLFCFLVSFLGFCWFAAIFKKITLKIKINATRTKQRGNEAEPK